MEDTTPLIPSVIDVKKRKAEKQKFVVGVGEPRPPPPEGIINSAALRRPHRHHVKRRTAGRMHRMAKAHLTDSEAECSQTTVTPVAMRRSQSQRSPQKRRWSSQPLQPSDERRQSSSSSINSNRNSPTLFVLQQQMAAPIEQTFNALANNLVAPNGAAYPAVVHAAAASPVLSPSSPQATRKPTLRSQFVNNHDTLHEDEEPYVTRELERIEREYQCLKQYRDPMVESLVRCMLVRKHIRKSSPINQQFNRTVSASTVATSKALHSGHRQAAAAVRRQQQEGIATTVRQRSPLNNTSLPSNQASPIASPRGMLSTLWERMVQGMST
ncbi:hypothetical protein BJV82DRAFT_319610 [Fennellomyces sp. T-0311]|nr:hypothetical protein BJV82DRAFT_319610 [Fennellomyces sp. T-0311]